MSTNHINLTKRPAFRKLRAYSFDPSLSLRMDTVDINNITYKLDWEHLEPGPVGEYLEVIDYDPTVKRFYKPVDLRDRYIVAQDGLEPSESNPQFHQQMVYAVAMTTIKNFENALGRKVLWSARRTIGGKQYEGFVRRLRVYPHALRDANAFYSPLKKALLFGYFSSAPADETMLMPDSLVFTCLSHDIIAHELTHALLDGMHYYYNEASNPDVLAFHEAFADIVALFQHFTFPEVLKHQIARTRGDLSSQNLLGELAQQFGSAIGGYGSLRDAIGERDPETGKWRPKEPNGDDYRLVQEPHARGSILVAAVFEAFLSIYKNRIADLLRIASGGTGVLPQGNLHPDLVNRLANEAAKSANHVLNMCIRALDYCPPVDITFGEYLRAIITADVDLVRDDEQDYRLAFIDAFRRRGIYPTGIKTLSVESLQYKLWNLGVDKPRPDQNGESKIVQMDSTGDTHTFEVDKDTHELLTTINNFLRDYANEIQYVKDRGDIYDVTRKYIAGAYSKQMETSEMTGLHARIKSKFGASMHFSRLTGLVFTANPLDVGVHTTNSEGYTGPSFQIQNLRLVNRIGPDGTQINHVVFSLTQRSGVLIRMVSYDSNGQRTAAAPSIEGYYDLTKPSVDVSPGIQAMEFRGGCTLIFDLDTQKLKYAVSKPLIARQDLEDQMARRVPQIELKIDVARVVRQYQYQYGQVGRDHNAYSLYFGEQLHCLSEPFAFLHQH
ncbi:hypothetical protein E5K00_09220 [Hymenobacter aquaticus]|uniref:Peptidase M4 n=1 Tax=Hymenobacter aquaticus TaxID=1867101 RepID=A0A4Z0Q5H6_9BACT|nr:hypothetical protein [Hymenobacter aquaticus]TGE25348.1 hypothetical protein E5K00_09220 [Hymenobacter aquaticus]